MDHQMKVGVDTTSVCAGKRTPENAALVAAVRAAGEMTAVVAGNSAHKLTLVAHPKCEAQVFPKAKADYAVLATVIAAHAKGTLVTVSAE